MAKLLSYIWHKTLKKIRGSTIINSEIHRSSKIESGSQIVNTIMKRHSFCGYDCDISNTEIGSFCSIANGVNIGGGMHPIHWVSTSPAFYSGRDSIKAKFSTHDRQPPKKVHIGHDVWIGQNALIKQGVEIGTGSVVGMGSVVTKDIPPYAVVAGVPAQIIKYRFDENTIKNLLKSKWWEMSNRKLTKLGEFSKNPIKFLDAINNDI